MTGEDDITLTADRLRDALGAAADLMVVPDAPALQAEQHVWRAKGWLYPLTAAASVVVIALAVVFVAHLASPGSTQGSTQGRTQGGARSGAQAPRPEFYLTASYALTGPNDLHFQVRRTAGGAVTDSMSISAANLGWGGYLTAAASDRAFYFAHYPYCTTAATVTTFSRITITGSGRISGVAAVGRPVPGMVTDFTVSPDGSRMAYNALPAGCAAVPGSRPAMTGGIQILDLSTGAIRTWQNTAAAQAQTTTVGGLSWAPDGRTLVIDEYSRVLGQADLTVYRLDTTSSGGSLQDHSTTLLRQNGNCSTCVKEALAGPDGSLTALESQAAGQQHTRMLGVSIPPAAGSPQTVLYSEPNDSTKPVTVNGTGLFADSSGQWVLLWPTGSPQHQQVAGWISGGLLQPLPGVARVFPQGIAW
jgi:WD40-like Beta Propeller Repeat